MAGTRNRGLDPDSTQQCLRAGLGLLAAFSFHLLLAEVLKKLLGVDLLPTARVFEAFYVSMAAVGWALLGCWLARTRGIGACAIVYLGGVLVSFHVLGGAEVWPWGSWVGLAAGYLSGALACASVVIIRGPARWRGAGLFVFLALFCLSASFLRPSVSPKGGRPLSVHGHAVRVLRSGRAGHWLWAPAAAPDLIRSLRTNPQIAYEVHSGSGTMAFCAIYVTGESAQERLVQAIEAERSHYSPSFYIRLLPPPDVASATIFELRGAPCSSPTDVRKSE